MNSQVREQEQSAILAVKKFFEALARRDVPELLSRLTDDVTWSVPGKPDQVPWTGERSGSAQMRTFFEVVSDSNVAQVRSFELHKFFVDGADVLVPGSFHYFYPGSRREYAGPFVMHFVVRNGLVAHYRIFEDSEGIADAYLGR